MNDNYVKKYSFGRILVMLVMLCIVVVGGTFAWFTYTSKESALVLTIGEINDTQIKLSPYQIKETITPGNTYTSGVYSNVEVVNGGERTTLIVLYYKINNLNVDLIDKGLAYTVVDSSTEQIVKSGYFSDLIDTSEPLPEQVVILDESTSLGSTSNYKVYLWLDSSKGEQNELQNTSLDMELNGTIGSVSIDGENTYGQVLVANAAGASNGGNYTYQWYTNTTNSTTDGIAIDGANSNEYTIGVESIDKYIYVVVSVVGGSYDGRIYTDITDNENNESGIVMRKAATLTVEPKTLDLTYPIVDSATVGYTYDGDGEVSCNSEDINVVTCTVDTNTKKVIVTPKSSSASTTISLSATQGATYNATTSANVTVNVSGGNIDSGTVTISGTNTYGDTLTATLNLDTNLEVDNYKYQWYTNTTNSTTGGTVIEGATNSTYKPTSVAYDKYVYVLVTLEKENYNDITFSDITDASTNTTDKVAKRKIIVTAGSKSKVYDGTALTDSSCTLTAGTMAFSHTISSCTMTNESAITDAGSVNNVISKVTLSKGNGYYDITTIDGTLTVTKANNQITGTAKTLYVNETQDMSSLVSNVKGTLTYKIKSQTTSGSSLSGKMLTAGVLSSSNDNDGTVVVTVTDDGGTNYNASSVDVTVTVQKYTRILTWNTSTPTSVTYGDTSKKATVSVGGSGGTVGAVSYSADGTSYLKVDSSSGTLTPVAYSAGVNITANLARTTTVKTASITKSIAVARTSGSVTLSATSGTTTYGTATKTFTVSKHHGGTLSVSDDNSIATVGVSGSTVTISNLATLNVGTKVVVTVKSAKTSQYNEASATYTLTVNKASCSCTISSVPTLEYPKTVTGNINYTCTGDGTISVVSGTTGVITVGTVETTSTPLTAKSIGTSKITVSQGAGNNYDVCTSDSKDVTVGSSTYTINYYLGNGTSTEGKTKLGSSTCKYGSSCTLTSWSTLGGTFPYGNNGWKFAGWSSLQDGKSVDYTDSKKITYNLTSDLNLYAVGARTFKFYGGIAPTSMLENGSRVQYWNPYSTSTSYMTSIDVPNAPEISGWEHIGYRGNNTASSTTTMSAGSYTGIPNNLSGFDFRAIYKRTVTVSYNSNGGSGTTNSTTGIQYYNSGYATESGVNSGENVSKPEIILAANGFTRTSYSFSKWAEGSVSGTEYAVGATYIFDNAVNESDTVTMYAKWNENLLSGGSVKITGTNTYGETLTAEITDTNPVATYTYQWYTNTTNSTTGGTAIDGATSNKYQAKAEARGKYLYVVVTATKDDYSTKTFSDITDATTNTTDMVAKRKITVTAGSKSKVYDGNALTDNSCTLTSGSFAFSHSITSCTMTSGSTITNAGSVDNVISSVNMSSGKANYDITFEDGMLTITKASCTCSISSVTSTMKYPTSTSGTISYTCGGDGVKSVTSGTTSVITVGTVGATSTPLTAKAVGTSKITVSQASGTNYKTCTSDSENVTVSASTYTIKYDANGGSGAPGSQTKTYGIVLTLSSTKPTRTGYTFSGWSTSSSATSATYNAGDSYTTNEAITLYAVWRINKVKVQYHVNGGTITKSTTSDSGNTYEWTTSDGLVYRDGELFEQKINYGTSDNLNNYNYSKYINISKTGYTAVEGAEWICSSGCTTENKTFDQTVDYTSVDYCDTSNGDCTVIMKVNWRKSKVIIKYHVNGGTITSSTTSDSGTTYNWTTSSSLVYRNGSLFEHKVEYGESVNLKDYNNSKYINITKSGYKAIDGAEWICSSGCTTANSTFDQTGDYNSSKFCDASNGDCTVILKVNWIESPLYLYNKGTGEDDWDKVFATENTDFWSKGQANKESDHLYLNTYASSSTNRWAAFITDSKIDLTGYNTLYFNVKSLELNPTSNEGANIYLFVSSDNTDQWAEGSNDKVRTFATKTGTISLDVSSLNGKYYIGFRAAAQGNSSYYARIGISQVYLK